MIRVPKADGSGGYFLVQYDAWGRMTGIYEDTDQDGRLDLEGENPDQPVSLYRYDATGRRILKQLVDAEGPDDYVHFYHSGQQVVETRTGDDSGGVPHPNQLAPKHQFVWSPRYIDALILREENTDGDGTCTDADDQRLFYVADANYNVTAVVAKNPQGGQWHVAERYLYDPYGRVRVLNGDPAVDPDGQGDPSTYPEWSVDPGADGEQGTSDDGTTSDVSNTTLYTGRELDPATGLYYYRARYYHPHLGRFLTRDPLSYAAGDANLYRYVGSHPLHGRDPSGEKKTCCTLVKPVQIVYGGVSAMAYAIVPRGQVSTSPSPIVVTHTHRILCRLQRAVSAKYKCTAYFKEHWYSSATQKTYFVSISRNQELRYTRDLPETNPVGVIGVTVDIPIPGPDVGPGLTLGVYRINSGNDQLRANNACRQYFWPKEGFEPEQYVEF